MRTVVRSATLGAVALAVVGVAACTSSSDHSTAPAAAAPLTVDTTTGRLHGLRTADAREFLGVRYARPMTTRWTLPQPPVKAAGTVQATRPAKPCAQQGSAPGAGSTSSTSEDCLYVDVTTPRTMRKGERLPVMVWSHGGGYTSGSAAAYDAQRLATQGHVIVVTVNKRLGVFGYLGLPGLAGGGDFGLYDVVAALRWTRTNAAAFGGDPHNVTLFGESDGAMSSCALLTSPEADGLFDKLALSSGGTCLLNWPKNGLVVGAPPTTPYTSKTINERLSAAEAEQVGCTGSATTVLACLRKQPVKTLFKIFPSFSDVLTYDTALLPRNPATALLSGHVARVPVLSGNNQNEERAFVGGLIRAQPKAITTAGYPSLVRQAYGAKADKVLAQYPVSRFASAPLAFATLVTDASWACPTLAGNAALAGHGNQVYGYEFADPTAPDINGAASRSVPQGAAHATDLPYLFDLGGKSVLRTAEQQRLARTMIEYWSSFARTGRPTAAGTASWPRLTGPTGPVLQLAPTIRTVDLAAEHRCAFWSSVAK